MSQSAGEQRWLRRHGVGIGFELVGQESIHVEFARNRCAVVWPSGIVASGADVDLAIRDRRYRELDSVACGIATALRAVPQLVGEVGGVV